MNQESTESSRMLIRQSEARTILRTLAVAWAALATIGLALDGLNLLTGRIQVDEAAYAALFISSLAFVGTTSGRAAVLSHPERSRWIKWIREPLFGLGTMCIYAIAVVAIGFVLSSVGVPRALVFLQPLLLLIFPVYLTMFFIGRWARKRLSGTTSLDE